MFWPCETRTSTCRNLATISSGLYRFLAITVLLDVKDIPQVGPLQWGRITDGTVFAQLIQIRQHWVRNPVISGHWNGNVIDIIRIVSNFRLDTDAARGSIRILQGAKRGCRERSVAY